MHEYSVTKSLVELCNKEAKANGLGKVKKIKVKVGKFTGFSPESINFYFEYLKPKTRCAEARIVFTEIPIRVKCPDCKYEGVIEEPVFFCPECGKPNMEILSGREFYVESIEGE